jgi:hypothetical protein
MILMRRIVRDEDGSLPEATQKRIWAAVRVVLVVAGAITLSIGISGLLGLAVIDSFSVFMLFGWGIAMLLTGILGIDLIQFIY